MKIVHAFNGKKAWYLKKYLEDDLVTVKNTWHFQGASDLIDAGMRTFAKKYKNIDYVIVLAADTWLVKPSYVERLLAKMRTNGLRLATCAFGLPESKYIADVGMATDFFIVDLKWAMKYKMFPINYAQFYKKYEDLFLYQRGLDVLLEKLAWARYLEATARAEKVSGRARKWATKKLLRMNEREPVHINSDWVRKMYWPKMGLLTHHYPAPKKRILKQLKIKGGPEIKKLLKSTDLSYYNKGITRMEGNSN